MEAKTNNISILIVEDEVILANDIRMRLSSLNYEIVGIAPSVDKALDFLKACKHIDIILIDITLQGDTDGIALAASIKSMYNIPFIFLTSHVDSTTVERAKQAGASAYILKPFNDRQVSIAIELALVNFSKHTLNSHLFETKPFPKTENQVLQIKDSLFLKKDHHFERVVIDEILFLEADGNYTTIHTKTGRYLYSAILKNIETKFPVNQFLRVHRSYVVNINAISGFEGNQLFIDQHKIPVSKSHRDEVFRKFQKI